MIKDAGLKMCGLHYVYLPFDVGVEYTVALLEVNVLWDPIAASSLELERPDHVPTLLHQCLRFGQALDQDSPALVVLLYLRVLILGPPDGLPEEEVVLHDELLGEAVQGIRVVQDYSGLKNISCMPQEKALRWLTPI